MTCTLIYSHAANEAAPDVILEEEEFETDALSEDARTFLECAISDYNAMFNTSFDTSSNKFQNYYKDLSLRLKNQEIDLVIVVNMFLTGFDATTQHALGRQEPSGSWAATGVLPDEPDPQLGEDLRQYRHFPEPRAGNQRRHRAVRQPRCPWHRLAQAFRRVPRRIRREGRRIG